MKRFLISVLSVVLLYFAFDFGLGIVLDKLNSLDKSSPINYAMNEGSCANILFFGSSKCRSGYNPEIIEKVLGYSVHNYGIDGQNIYMDYFLVDAILSNSVVKPKLIVVDLTYFDIIDYPTYNKEKIRPLFRYYHNSNTARELINECEMADCLFPRISKLYGYNQSTLSLIQTIITSPSESNGYVPKIGSHIESLDTTSGFNKNKFYGSKEKYLNRLMVLCNKNDVPLIFVISPFYQKYICEIQWIIRLKEIAMGNNTTLLDYSQESDYLVHPEWFWDPFHLNNMGADHYSEFFAKELKQYL